MSVDQHPQLVLSLADVGLSFGGLDLRHGLASDLVDPGRVGISQESAHIVVNEGQVSILAALAFGDQRRHSHELLLERLLVGVGRSGRSVGRLCWWRRR